MSNLHVINIHTLYVYCLYIHVSVCMRWMEKENKESKKKERGVCFHFRVLCNGGTLGSVVYRSEPQDTQFPIAVSGAVP